MSEQLEGLRELAMYVAQHAVQERGPVPDNAKDAYIRGIEDALIVLAREER